MRVDMKVAYVVLIPLTEVSQAQCRLLHQGAANRGCSGGGWQRPRDAGAADGTGAATAPVNAREDARHNET